MKKSDRIAGSAFQQLTEDHCSILKRAFESYLIWEYFGDLIRNVHRGDAEYPRVFFFQPLTLALVSAAFDSFVVNLYKFHDNRSHELEDLVDVGVKHGGINHSLESSLRMQIKDAASIATKMNIATLRNQHVGHYNPAVEGWNALTTVNLAKKEVREYFKKIAAILQGCVFRARFNHSPPRYNQSEKQIQDNAKIIIGYISGKKSP